MGYNSCRKINLRDLGKRGSCSRLVWRTEPEQLRFPQNLPTQIGLSKVGPKLELNRCLLLEPLVGVCWGDAQSRDEGAGGRPSSGTSRGALVVDLGFPPRVRASGAPRVRPRAQSRRTGRWKGSVAPRPHPPPRPSVYAGEASTRPQVNVERKDPDREIR